MTKEDLKRVRLEQNAPQLLEEAENLVNVRKAFSESQDQDDKRRLADQHINSYKRLELLIKTIKGE